MLKRMNSVALLLAISSLTGACVDTSEEEDDIASAQEPLFLEGNRWPGGIVPVCWSAASQGRADFAALSRRVRDITDASWPAAANVEFTGWGACPSNTNGRVVVNLNDSTAANASVGFHGNVTHTVNLGVLRSDFNGGLIPHEFGHILGFGHEMRRPDFADEPNSACQEGNGTGDTVGTPADRDSIMASTGYCQLNPLLSGWDLVGVRNAYGTRAENVISAGSTLYARKLSTGDIYRRSGSTWSLIGGPGGQFVAVGSTLYGLSTDNSGVFRYSGSGTAWSQVGGAAAEILRCGGSLCATDPTTGQLYRYSGSGTAWTLIGDTRAAMYASTSTRTYRLTAARDAVQEYSGSGTTWTVVGGPAAFVFATTTSLYATSPVSGDIFQYSGAGTAWSVAGGPGRTFVGVGSTLYGLTPDRGGVWRYSGSGTNWTAVGGAADWIYGGTSGALHATDPTTKDIWRFDGASWTHMGQP